MTWNKPSNGGCQILETNLAFLCKKEKRMIFQRLFESNSSTYTYLLACSASREAILLDPVLRQSKEI